MYFHLIVQLFLLGFLGNENPMSLFSSGWAVVMEVPFSESVRGTLKK